MSSEDLYREFHRAGDFKAPRSALQLVTEIRDTIAAAGAIAIRESCLALQRLLGR